MNKQTYPIPEGCKAITMEIIDNTIVTTFEPEFKRGDVIYCEDNDGFSWVFILREKINRGFDPYEYFCSITSKGKITQMIAREKQLQNSTQPTIAGEAYVSGWDLFLN